MRTRFAWIIISLSLFGMVTPTLATGFVNVEGNKCTKIGSTRTVKGATYSCTKSGKTLKWRRGAVTVSPGTSTVVNSTTTSTTVAARACRTTSQITSRLPNELQKREWEAVVAKLQPIAASADSSAKTTASIDTFEDTNVGNLTYGRYYPQTYPAVISETQAKGCAYLALVLDLFVRFTGSDTSDETAKTGIQSAVKAVLQEVLTKYTKVDGYDVDVVLIEPVLNHCPGREMSGQRTVCPWNDWGFLYYRTAALTAAQVAATSATDIFSLSVNGATFPPRPFAQITGIGPSTIPVVTGDVRNLVPVANLSHQAASYVEFSDRTYELGQTISVDSSINVASLTVRTSGHTVTVDGRPVYGSGSAIPANIQTRIYRYNGSGEIPLAAQRSEFTRLVDVSQAVSFPHNSSVSFNLPSGTTLSQGKYLITFAISGWNPSGAYIRFLSFAEGDARQTDSYSGGRAYRSCNLRTGAGFRKADNPPVVAANEETVGTNCETLYPEISKGQSGARPSQHTWVWSDLAVTLNAP